MMKWWIFLCGGLVFLGLAAICGAEPLAPSAPLDPGMAMMVTPTEREVPDLATVKIPAYPGSEFCSVKKGKWGPSGAVWVQLLSKDSYAQVSQWYEKKMKGWYCREWGQGVVYNCSDKDPGEAGNYDYETFNVVEILRSNLSFPCRVEGMKTQIAISFQPD